MGWVTQRTIFAAAALALGSSGCTAAVLQSAQNEPAALAALPFALIVDAIVAAPAQAVGRPITTAPPPPPDGRYRYWKDPDDWVSECSGPPLCADYEYSVCRGGPGDCACSCTASLPPTPRAAEPRLAQRGAAAPVTRSPAGTAP
jgi:hypothetical protein